MAWPGITDYSEAIQNPPLCFKGADLEAGGVALNPRGMPLVFSGNFACVYSIEVGGRKFAVRCFTREVKDQQTRYNKLSEYLINVLPPSFVHFEYLEQGINVRGDWYPIVRMEWVEGESLSSFVGSNLADPVALHRVAAQWRGGPAASLRGLGIAHNDLQHGNVMVQADGRIRLVDYDGMFLPGFRGERSPELGHKNFQHPLRTAEDYDAYVDNFPSLVLYLSLLAIASDPGLWNDFYNDDNLIFTREDYADPGKSPLFDKLKKSPDQTVAKLAERLEECCALPVEDVPDLETILRDIPPSPAPAPSASPTPAASSPSQPPAQPASGSSYRQALTGQPAAPAQPPAASTQPVAPGQTSHPPPGLAPTPTPAQAPFPSRLIRGLDLWIKLRLSQAPLPSWLIRHLYRMDMLPPLAQAAAGRGRHHVPCMAVLRTLSLAGRSHDDRRTHRTRRLPVEEEPALPGRRYRPHSLRDMAGRSRIRRVEVAVHSRGGRGSGWSGHRHRESGGCGQEGRARSRTRRGGRRDPGGRNRWHNEPGYRPCA